MANGVPSLDEPWEPSAHAPELPWRRRFFDDRFRRWAALAKKEAAADGDAPATTDAVPQGELYEVPWMPSSE